MALDSSPWAAAMAGPNALNKLQAEAREDLRGRFLPAHGDKPAVCVAFALMAEAAALLEVRRGPEFAAAALERVADGVRRGGVTTSPFDAARATEAMMGGPGLMQEPAAPPPARAVQSTPAAHAPVQAAPAAAQPAPQPAPQSTPTVAPQPAAPQPAPTVVSAPAPQPKPAPQLEVAAAAPAKPKPAPLKAAAPLIISPKKKPEPAAPPPAPAPAPEIEVKASPAPTPTAAKPKVKPGGVIDLRPRGGGAAVA